MGRRVVRSRMFRYSAVHLAPGLGSMALPDPHPRFNSPLDIKSGGSSIRFPVGFGDTAQAKGDLLLFFLFFSSLLFLFPPGGSVFDQVVSFLCLTIALAAPASADREGQLELLELRGKFAVKYSVCRVSGHRCVSLPRSGFAVSQRSRTSSVSTSCATPWCCRALAVLLLHPFVDLRA